MNSKIYFVISLMCGCTAVAPESVVVEQAPVEMVEAAPIKQQAAEPVVVAKPPKPKAKKKKRRSKPEQKKAAKLKLDEIEREMNEVQKKLQSL